MVDAVPRTGHRRAADVSGCPLERRCADVSVRIGTSVTQAAVCQQRPSAAVTVDDHH
jgi:hypothetical protein